MVGTYSLAIRLVSRVTTDPFPETCPSIYLFRYISLIRLMVFIHSSIHSFLFIAHIFLYWFPLSLGMHRGRRPMDIKNTKHKWEIPSETCPVTIKAKHSTFSLPHSPLHSNRHVSPRAISFISPVTKSHPVHASCRAAGLSAATSKMTVTLRQLLPQSSDCSGILTGLIAQLSCHSFPL